MRKDEQTNKKSVLLSRSLATKAREEQNKESDEIKDNRKKIIEKVLNKKSGQDYPLSDNANFSFYLLLMIFLMISFSIFVLFFLDPNRVLGADRSKSIDIYKWIFYLNFSF